MNKLPLLVLFLTAIAHAQPGSTDPQPQPQQPSGPTGVPVQDPATGPGLGQQPAPPANTAPATTPVAPPAQLSPQELDELKAAEGDYDKFIDAATKHDTRMRQIARHEYNQRTAELEKRYAERIARAEGDKGKLFANTLARLEKFLQDHPSHEQFTPDAMFRLADV